MTQVAQSSAWRTSETTLQRWGEGHVAGGTQVACGPPGAMGGAVGLVHTSQSWADMGQAEIVGKACAISSLLPASPGAQLGAGAQT